MNKLPFLLLIISLGLLVSAVQGLNYTITAEVGETYIQWRWHPIPPTTSFPPLDIFLDDNTTPIITNYTLDTYLVTKLNPDERHNIGIYNTSSRINGTIINLAKGTATTLNTSYGIYILLIICVILTGICFIIGETVRFLLITILNIILCLFGVSLSSGRGGILYLFVALSIITGLILLVNGIPKLKEEINWW